MDGDSWHGRAVSRGGGHGGQDGRYLHGEGMVGMMGGYGMGEVQMDGVVRLDPVSIRLIELSRSVVEDLVLVGLSSRIDLCPN